MIPKNIKAAEELIEKYESITLEDINTFKSDDLQFDEIANKITGFGYVKSCTLCKVVNKRDKMFNPEYCKLCIYGFNNKIFMPCFKGYNKYTYYNIEKAHTAKGLLNAFKARAKHIRKLLKDNKWKS